VEKVLPVSIGFVIQRSQNDASDETETPQIGGFCAAENLSGSGVECSPDTPNRAIITADHETRDRPLPEVIKLRRFWA
jgi:hypothetical protein